MMNLTSLERVLNIKLKEYIAAHSRSVLVVFFFLPMIVSKIAILIGVTNIGFVSPWEISYRTVFGGAEGYTLTVVMYWVMSPLVFLWVYSQANYQKVPLKKAIIVIAIPVCWLLLIGFAWILFYGVALSTLEHRVRFLHKKFYFLGGGISVSACYMDCLFFLIFLIFLRHYL